MSGIGGVAAGPGPATRTALYDGFAKVGKALASGRRLEILDLLNQSPRTVSSLAQELQQSVANTSQHLQVLVTAELVVSRRIGTHVEYAVTDAQVSMILDLVRDIAVRRLSDVGRLINHHLGDRSDVPVISRRALTRALGSRNMILIDVRTRKDFEAGHIVGAVHVAPGEIDRLAAGLAPGNEVVAYCRGEYCSLADEAVRRLRRHGVNARRLEDGFPHWMNSGGQIERTPNGKQQPAAR